VTGQPEAGTGPKRCGGVATLDRRTKVVWRPDPAIARLAPAIRYAGFALAASVGISGNTRCWPGERARSGSLVSFGREEWLCAIDGDVYASGKAAKGVSVRREVLTGQWRTTRRPTALH
jgi:hypothetical protein